MGGILLSALFKFLGKRKAIKTLGLANAAVGGGAVLIAIIGYIVKANYTITLDQIDISLILGLLWILLTANRRSKQPNNQQQYNDNE